MTTAPLPIAVLISGTGRTLKHLIDQVATHTLSVEIRLVLSSHAQAGGLEHAIQARIPTDLVVRTPAMNNASFCEAIFQPCRDVGAELVVMAGFIKHVLIPGDFQNRVVNCHPGLIPAFCGQGFYGQRVHKAVLAYGVKLSGCTIHFVDDQYDHGPIIMQCTVPVAEDDTPKTLAHRVFALECRTYTETLQLIATNRVRVNGRRVSILPLDL